MGMKGSLTRAIALSFLCVALMGLANAASKPITLEERFKSCDPSGEVKRIASNIVDRLKVNPTAAAKLVDQNNRDEFVKACNDIGAATKVSVNGLDIFKRALAHLVRIAPPKCKLSCADIYQLVDDELISTP
ncbi:hypothetical protein vseg_001288 [Gypsophila vaccaria]